MEQTTVESFNNIPAAVFDEILKKFHRAYRPLMLGQISAEIGWSLERTEEMINVLISDGILRRATEEELRKLDLPSDASVFALVGQTSLAQARW